MTPGRIALKISLKTCCCYALKDEIELCSSPQRLSKSVSCCNSVAKRAKSSSGMDSRNVGRGAVAMLKRLSMTSKSAYNIASKSPLSSLR